MDKIRKLTKSLLILLTVCTISQPLQAETSIYVFSTDQSTVIQTGGFAGVNITYTVTGQFQLAVDSDSGVASFELIDANLADETGAEYGRSLEEIFNMTGLDGIPINKTTIDFKGKTTDGTESDVRLMLSFMDDSAHLTGNTTPPPNSADMFFYDVNAVATKKYTGGTGEPNDPYQIDTAEDLMLLGETPEDYDKNFILTADIDLDPNLPDHKVFDRAVIAPDINDAGDGFQGATFTGVFDGDGYTITNLTISGRRYLGLFGQLGLGAMISNLGLEAIDVNGTSDYIGGLAGYNEGHITKNYSTGTVHGDDEIGGLLGSNLGYVTECYSAGLVKGDESVGGLVGDNYGSITTSYSTCTVIGHEDVGGLVSHNSGDITTSYSICTVNGEDEYVGGLVSYNSGSITTSYSTGVVHGGRCVGGLVGCNSGNGNIISCSSNCMVSGFENIGGLLGNNGYGINCWVIRCFSTGLVTGTEDVGGLVGDNDANIDNSLTDDNDTNIIDSFWDIETSNRAYSEGGTGKTTAEMQTASTFLEAGWDFVGETDNGTEDIWSICEKTNYPRFVWQIPLIDFVCPDGVTIEDFSFLMVHWLDDNCDASNGYCEGTDLDQSGTVDAIDLEIFYKNWPNKN